MKDSKPPGYWESCDARQGGVIVDIKGNVLCVRSLVDMPLGADLGIRIFLPLGSDLCRFDVLARTVRKQLLCEEGWESYEYELEVVEISEQDRPGIRPGDCLYS